MTPSNSSGKMLPYEITGDIIDEGTEEIARDQWIACHPAGSSGSCFAPPRPPATTPLAVAPRRQWVEATIRPSCPHLHPEPACGELAEPSMDAAAFGCRPVRTVVEWPKIQKTPR